MKVFGKLAKAGAILIGGCALNPAKLIDAAGLLIDAQLDSINKNLNAFDKSVDRVSLNLDAGVTGWTDTKSY